MDKIQKELIDTYLRKRNIQVFTRHHVVKPWEYKYLKATGQLQEKHYKGGVAELVVKDPSLFDDFEQEMYDMRGYELYYVLGGQPQLIDRVTHNLHTLSTENVVTLIRIEASLIKYFERFIPDISGDDISKILRKHPHLVDHFKPYIHKLGYYDRQDFVKAHPDWAEFIDVKGGKDF